MLAAMSWWSTLARAAGRGGSRAATIGYGTAAMPSARTAWPTTQESTVLLPLRSHLVTRSASSRSPSVTVPKIVFLGPPGVGKGTYAKRIAKWLGVPHVAVGDLIRNEVKAGTPLGKEVENTVSSGGLVSDDVVLGLLKGFLEESCGASGSASATQVLHGKTIDASGGYILDGFPRTAKQAEMLSEFQGVNLVLNLYLREDVLIEKCLGRRICPDCNGNYNVADIYRPAENGKPEIGKRDRERKREGERDDGQAWRDATRCDLRTWLAPPPFADCCVLEF